MRDRERQSEKERQKERQRERQREAERNPVPKTFKVVAPKLNNKLLNNRC